MRTVLALSILLVPLIGAAKPCQQMTQCAVEKCLDYGKLGSMMAATPRDQLFESLVLKFDMMCIAVKCTKPCKACKACHYALDQIASLVKGRDAAYPTNLEKAMCPKLEGCVEKCLRTDAGKTVQCVADKCNVHCYDGDCSSCRSVSKRMFTKVCSDLKMTSLPQLAFDGDCSDLFQKMSEEFVDKKRRA